MGESYSKAAATRRSGAGRDRDDGAGTDPARPFSCTSQSTLPSMGSLALNTVRRST